MDNDNKEIGMRVRKIREEQKLSRERLAERANISTQFLADIETGKKGMSVTTLKSLCCALGVSADRIVYGECSCTGADIEQLLSSVCVEKQEKIKEIVKTIMSII